MFINVFLDTKKMDKNNLDIKYVVYGFANSILNYIKEKNNKITNIFQQGNLYLFYG